MTALPETPIINEMGFKPFVLDSRRGLHPSPEGAIGPEGTWVQNTSPSLLAPI